MISLIGILTDAALLPITNNPIQKIKPRKLTATPGVNKTIGLPTKNSLMALNLTKLKAAGNNLKMNATAKREVYGRTGPGEANYSPNARLPIAPYVSFKRTNM